MPDKYDQIAAGIVQQWIGTLAPMIADAMHQGSPETTPAKPPSQDAQNVETLTRAFVAKVEDEWPETEHSDISPKIRGGAADLLLTKADINLILVVMTTALANEAMIGREAPQSPSFCKPLLLDEMKRANEGRPSRVLPQKIDGTTKGREKADEQIQEGVDNDNGNPDDGTPPAEGDNSGLDIPEFLDRRGEGNGGADSEDNKGKAKARIGEVVAQREAKLTEAGYSKSRIRSLELGNMRPEEFKQFLLEEGIE